MSPARNCSVLRCSSQTPWRGAFQVPVAVEVAYDERADQAEVEHPCRQRHEADYPEDDPSRTANHQEPEHRPEDPPGGLRHEPCERYRFTSFGSTFVLNAKIPVRRERALSPIGQLYDQD